MFDIPAINPFLWLIVLVLRLYSLIVIVAVIASWLVVFRIVNMSSPAVRQILRGLEALTEPVFRQIRRFLPSVGGIDLSPIIVIVVMIFLEKLVWWGAYRMGIY